VLLDTHAWIWLRFGTLTAKADVLEVLREAAEDQNWFVPSFSFYEIAHAVSRKRLQLDMPLLDWLRGGSSLGMPLVLPVSPEIAAATHLLPESFHGDPGDRIVAATAVAHNLTLCTHDKELLRYGKQGLFRTVKVNEKKA